MALRGRKWLAPGTYVVKVTDINGCTSTSTAVVGSSCNSNPPGPLIGPDGACTKQSGIVYCVTLNPFATSYIWTLPKGVTAVGTINEPCITVRFSSKFKGGYICAQAVTPCNITTKTCMLVSHITKVPRTPGKITGPVSFCPNQTATYSIAAVPNATSYLWTTTGNLSIISGQGTASVVVKAASNFNGGSVKVKAVNCKGNSSTKALAVKKGILCKIGSNNVALNESTITIKSLSDIIAYPNPTSANVIVSYHSNTRSNYSLKVFDMIGKIIILENISAEEGYNSVELNLENVVKGIYFISLESENSEDKTLRLIVK